MESHSDSPLHSVAVLGLTYPYGLAAILIAFDSVVAWDVAGLTVMMEHIPLYTSADPCSRHTDVGRLDHILMVEDVISVCLVYGIEQTTSDFRKDAELHILVLKVESSVLLHLTVSGHVVVQRIRIDASAGSLI